MPRFIPGPSGKLEVELWLPEANELVPEVSKPTPRAAALVCHPHPRFGGTMHNTVVFRTARALRRAGCAVLRLNFRGVGDSAGESEGSDAEIEDARAALDFLELEFAGIELWAAGFSFGARTVAALAAEDPRIAHLVLVALPCKAFDCSALARVTTPGYILMAASDEFGNLAELRSRFPDLHPDLAADEISDTDHLFRHRTPALEERVHAHAMRELASRT